MECEVVLALPPLHHYHHLLGGPYCHQRRLFHRRNPNIPHCYYDFDDDDNDWNGQKLCSEIDVHFQIHPWWWFDRLDGVDVDDDVDDDEKDVFVCNDYGGDVNQRC